MIGSTNWPFYRGELTMHTKEEVARKLADAHYMVDLGITHIIRFKSTVEAEVSPSEPIKLLEVNENTIASGVMPIQFDALPTSGVPYPSVIIEVTPDEYRRIQAKELKLPDGWTEAAPLPKASANGAG
jgi:hypothetical protein